MAEKQKIKRVEYTKEMNKAGYTILIPSMAPIHFAMLRYIFRSRSEEHTSELQSPS